VIHISQMNYLFDIASPALYVMTGINVTVFLFFGVWSLHQRFQQHQEWAIRTQAIVLLAVMVFYFVEVTTLRLLLVGETVYFIFSLLGLITTGLALYGHIVVSLFSRLLVELVVPDTPGASAVPRLGPAEMLEHEQDWEGALNEYYVLAHIYPGNALIYGRIATNLLQLERPEEAAQWFERSLKHTSQANDALVLLRRLWDAYEAVGERNKAREAVHRFIERFPDHEASPLLMRQIGLKADSGSEASGEPCAPKTKKLPKAQGPAPSSGPSGLASLDEEPLDHKEAAEPSSKKTETGKRTSTLESLDDSPLSPDNL
jgi:hypothetical protein